MASPTGTASLQSALQFGENAYQLKDFVTKCKTPTMVKVTKGQYRNIGVSKSVHNELLLHSIKSSTKVLAENVKMKDKKPTVVGDTKFSLPVAYQGWFELLSEDGRSIKALSTVHDLVRQFPHSCLVRESIKAYIPKESGELTLENHRTVRAGEQLTLVGDITIPVSTIKGKGKVKLLRCFDMKGDSVYLNFEQKGMFSPIAGRENISGVHGIKGLLQKFRLPITVRLVHGIIPSRIDRNSFSGIFRLLSVYTDETAFVCPIQKDTKMVPISTREPLKFAPCRNFDDVKDSEEYKNVAHRCSKMIASYLNSIHVLINLPEGWIRSKPGEKVDPKVPAAELKKKKSETEEDILFKEVDDIYQYVRDGGPVPRPRPRPTHLAEASVSSAGKNAISVEKQVPAPKEDDDYWEEPIYEQIEKFQRKPSDKQLYHSGSSPDASNQQNLDKRHVYRFNSEPGDSRPLAFVAVNASNGNSSQDLGFNPTATSTEEGPPEVPPKLFDSDGNGKAINITQIFVEDMSATPGSSIIGKPSRAANGHGPLSRSISSPPSTLPSPADKAKARLPDQESIQAPTSTSDGAQSSGSDGRSKSPPVRSESARRKLKAMYL